MNLRVSSVYKDFFNVQNRYVVLYGGAGSGKSYVTAQKILMRMLTEEGHKFLVVRKVKATLRESVFALFKAVIADLGLSDVFKANETNMSFECLLNGNKIITFGLDNSEKLKSVAGITSIWIEEATELSESDFDQLDLRLRGETKHYKQIITTFNPVSANNWVKKRFFDKAPKDTYTLKTTYLDNPFIDDSYKAVMDRLKEQNYDYYKIYALGNWGTLKGLIYQDYEVVDSMPSYYEKEFIGIDFGYNHPYAITHIRIDGKYLYIDELFYESFWENPKVVEWAKENMQFAKNIQGYGDSARPDLIKEWNGAGFNIAKANKAVFEGINTVKGFKLRVTKRSVNIIKELGLYVWKTDKEGNSLDEPVKLNDDGLDSVRYGLTQYISKVNPIKTTTIKGL